MKKRNSLFNIFFCPLPSVPFTLDVCLIILVDYSAPFPTRRRKRVTWLLFSSRRQEPDKRNAIVFSTVPCCFEVLYTMESSVLLKISKVISSKGSKGIREGGRVTQRWYIRENMLHQKVLI